MRRVTIPGLLADLDLLRDFIADMQAGAVAALPTDTLYGLGVDGQSAAGVRAVYELKGRESGKPLILFLDDARRLPELGIRSTPAQETVWQRFWPGQLTVVFPLPQPSPLAGFTFPTLGIRVPAHPDLLGLLRAYPGFILTTSSNPSGAEPLSDPDGIAATFATGLTWLLDGGPLPSSPPSTVLDLSVSPPRILREGRISRSELEASGILPGA